VLGVPSTASDAEVTRAYRRLLSQHHPDKLVSKGLPPDVLKLADEKTYQIRSAYETVTRARAA
jgi:DnaJ like chaperone protein